MPSQPTGQPVGSLPASSSLGRLGPLQLAQLHRPARPARIRGHRCPPSWAVILGQPPALHRFPPRAPSPAAPHPGHVLQPLQPRRPASPPARRPSFHRCHAQKQTAPARAGAAFFFARLRRIFWPAVKFLPVVKISSRGQNFGVRSKFCLSVRFLVLVKISVGGQNLSSTTSSTITSAYLSSRAA